MSRMGKKIICRCCVVVLIMGLLCGCAAQTDDTAYVSEDTNRDVVSAEDVTITLLTEDVSEESVDKVKDTWKRLSEKVPLADIEIAIGPSTIHEKRDGLINFTELEIESDDFNVIFTDKCTDLPYWKTVGLSEYAFDYVPVNTEESVKEFLEARDEKTFPLFVLFFLENYAKDSDIQMAKDCAYYLTKYALGKYSYRDFSENDYRSDWISSLGVASEFRYDEIDELVEASSMTQHSDYITIKFNGDNWELHDKWWLESADDVYTLLYKSENGIRNLAKRVEQESEFYDEGTFRKHVSVTTVDGLTSYYGGYYKVYLARPFHFLHEYVHSTIPYSLSEAWILEGTAEYFSLDFWGDYFSHLVDWDDEEECYHEMYDLGIIPEDYKNEYEQDGILEYYEKEIENYQKLRKKYGDEYNNYQCMKMAEGVTDLMYFGTEIGEKASRTNVANADYQLEVKNKRLGNKLSYSAAMLVVSDLIDEYGIDSIISGTGSFEEDFGMTADEYVQNYLDNKLYLHFIGE